MTSRPWTSDRTILTATLLVAVTLSGCGSALSNLCISGLRSQAHLVEGQSEQLRGLLTREAQILSAAGQSGARDDALEANRQFQSTVSLVTRFWNTAPASTEQDAGSMEERIPLDRERLQEQQTAHEAAVTRYINSLPDGAERTALTSLRDNVRSTTGEVLGAMTSVGDVAGACR